MSKLCKEMVKRVSIVVLCATLLVTSFPIVAVSGSDAFAVTTEVDAEPDELQQLIEDSNSAYEAACSRVSELEVAVSDSEARIAELEAQLPEQRERGGNALKELYKIQRDGSSLVDLVLSSDSFLNFVSRVDFLDRIFDQHLSELEVLSSMVDELNNTRAQLQTDLSEAEAEREQAARSLSEAQEAREQAQREAQLKAEEEARAAEEEARVQQEQAAQGEQPESDSSSGGDSQMVTPPSEDGADWSSDKTTFVESWAGRIDAYLAGSPLSGQGAVFAAAAWDYGVDPRFSPAISCVESSKGAACFLPYNAWGWGSISWGSWEEAIDSHVRGLARGYGYTLSEEAAKKYCPPNWQHWYSRVGEEMSRI